MTAPPWKFDPIRTHSYRCADEEWERILELALRWTEETGRTYTASDVIRYAISKHVTEALARGPRRAR